MSASNGSPLPAKSALKQSPARSSTTRPTPTSNKPPASTRLQYEHFRLPLRPTLYIVLLSFAFLTLVSTYIRVILPHLRSANEVRRRAPHDADAKKIREGLFELRAEWFERSVISTIITLPYLLLWTRYMNLAVFTAALSGGLALAPLAWRHVCCFRSQFSATASFLLIGAVFHGLLGLLVLEVDRALYLDCGRHDSRARSRQLQIALWIAFEWFCSQLAGLAMVPALTRYSGLSVGLAVASGTGMVVWWIKMPKFGGLRRKSSARRIEHQELDEGHETRVLDGHQVKFEQQTSAGSTGRVRWE